MFRTMHLRLLTWARGQTRKRQAKQRVAELEHRLKEHDKDIDKMCMFPDHVLQRLESHRAKIVEQLENAKRFI